MTHVLPAGTVPIVRVPLLYANGVEIDRANPAAAPVTERSPVIVASSPIVRSSVAVRSAAVRSVVIDASPAVRVPVMPASWAAES
jgi:hypothetical protein